MLGLCVRTSKPLTSKFGHRYRLARKTPLTASTAPENAPDSRIASPSIAMSVPSRFTPVFRRMMTCGAGIPASSSSRRVMT